MLRMRDGVPLEALDGETLDLVAAGRRASDDADRDGC